MNPNDYTGKEIESQPALVGELVDDDGVAIAPEHSLARHTNLQTMEIHWGCTCGLPLGSMTEQLAVSADRAAIQQTSLAIAGNYALHIQEVEAQAR